MLGAAYPQTLSRMDCNGPSGLGSGAGPLRALAAGSEPQLRMPRWPNRSDVLETFGQTHEVRLEILDVSVPLTKA